MEDPGVDERMMMLMLLMMMLMIIITTIIISCVFRKCDGGGHGLD